MNNYAKNKYVKSSLSCVFSVKGVYTVHYFKYGQKFEFEGESHPFWEFVYIDAGEVQIVADGKDFTLCQGEAYFHKPDEHHSICTKNKFANSVIISFDCPSPAMNTFFDKKIVLSKELKSIVRKIVDETSGCFTDKLDAVYLTKMTKARNQIFGGEQLIKTYIEQLLILCHRDVLALTTPHSATSHCNSGLTEKIIELLNSKIYQNVSLDEISSVLFFSKTHIKTVFKKETGQTVMQYFAKMKIDEAKKLISTGKFTYTEIAYKLGYSSLFYFSRQFKKVTDMSPSQYAGSIKVDYLL